MTLTPAKALRALVGMVAAQPLLSVFHEVLILGIAGLLSAMVNFGAVGWLLGQLVTNPVYAHLMTESIGNVRTEGLVIAGETGRQLHDSLPALFLQPEFAAPGAWVSAVLHRGSTVLSVFMTRTLAELLLIVLGMWLLRAAWRGRTLRNVLVEGRARDWIAIGLGLYIQAESIGALFRLTLSPAFSRLEDTGVGFVLSIFLRLDHARYDWLMTTALPLLIPALLTILGLGIGWFSGHVISRLRMGLSKAGYPLAPVRQRSAAPVAVPITLGLLALLTWPFSGGYFGLAKTQILTLNKTQRISPKPTVLAFAFEPSPTPSATPTLVPPAAKPVAVVTSLSAPMDIVTATVLSLATPTATISTPTPLSTSTPTPTLTPEGPSLVTFRLTSSGSTLVVNGRDIVATGINYNVNYTGLPDPIKSTRHRKDFRIMREAGANSVIGWGVYDQATLDAASEAGIGVIMPFELDPQGSFENEAYRQEIKTKFLKYVQQYKNSPAVWGWNPGGDELLHRMDTEQHRTSDKLQHAADFLVELSASAFQSDPNHVSILKEPRDWYIPYLDVAIKKCRAEPACPDPSRYLIYAVNVYGHPDEIVNAIQVARVNSDGRMKIGFLVGEYGPFGLPREDRAENYARIADDVYALSPMGGYVYVFGPDQPNPQAPNPYDPLRLLVNEFSLMDIEDNPVDGAFAILSVKWLQVKGQIPQAIPIPTPK